MQKALRLLVAALLFLNTPLHRAFADEVTGAGPSGAREQSKPLPPSKEEESPLTIQQALARMFVSHPYDNTDTGFVDSGKDIAEYELKALQDFRAGRGDYQWITDQKIPKGRREIVMLRYHMADDRFTDELVGAKKDGFGGVRFITDLNDSLEGEWKDGEKHNSDFKKAKIKTDGQGKTIGDLIKAGFGFNDAKHGIFSIPLYNKNMDRKPLMHQKEMYFVVRDDKGKIIWLEGFGGTANLATRNGPDGKPFTTRYNRSLRTTDMQLLRYEYEHSRLMAETFAAGKESKDIPPMAPLKIKYQDGVIEVAYTDGKYNPNDRKAELFERAAKDPKAIQIVKVWKSQFVDTASREQAGLIAAMKAQPDFNLFGVFDQQFIELDGFGLAPQLDGFDILRPFGRAMFGVGDRLEKRTELYGYMRPIEGVEQHDLEGQHLTRHMWHDKTDVIEVVENGVHRYYIFTGSFNDSNNFHNAERQMMLVVEGKDNPIARAFINSIEKVVKAEPQWALPLPLAVVRMELGRFTGHTDLEIPVELVKALNEATRKKDFDRVEKLLEEAAALPTKLKKKPSAGEVADRIGKMRAFLEWHAATIPKDYLPGHEVSLRRLASISVILRKPEMSAFAKKAAIRSVLFDPDNKDEKITEKRLAEAWKALGIKEKMPNGREFTEAVAQAVSDATPSSGDAANCKTVMGATGKVAARKRP